MPHGYPMHSFIEVWSSGSRPPALTFVRHYYAGRDNLYALLGHGMRAASASKMAGARSYNRANLTQAPGDTNASATQDLYGRTLGP